jgi:hypothetical protein
VLLVGRIIRNLQGTFIVQGKEDWSGDVDVLEFTALLVKSCEQVFPVIRSRCTVALMNMLDSLDGSQTPRT